MTYVGQSREYGGRPVRMLARFGSAFAVLVIVLAGGAAAAPHARAADRIFWTSGVDHAIHATDPSGGGNVETLYPGQVSTGLDIDVGSSQLIWGSETRRAISSGPL